MDEAEAVRRQETYLGLVGRLHAEHPADLVRALYPLVFDRPVESHEELMELVRQISSRTVINPRCSEQSAYDLRVLINTYTDVGDVLSRVASRISSTGAVELIQRIKRETGSGAVYWEHHGGTRADDRHEDDMLVQVPGSSWVLASSGSIPSSKQQGREAEIIHGK
uniref:Uncharacterized protein n=1 Tax=Tetraselmis chuii TaxID=63592 RepID=A0A7S1X8F5_9CHLO